MEQARSHQDSLLEDLHREKSKLTDIIAEFKSTLDEEIKSKQTLQKSHHEELQALFRSETERRETELKEEREEKKLLEQQFGDKIQMIQDKFEKFIKERESELKAESEQRFNEQKNRYETEIRHLKDETIRLVSEN